MRNLRQFTDATAYNAAKSTLVKPCVSLLKDSMDVMYDPLIAQIGDYLYSDLSFSSEYDSSKTPIAICVAPKNHFSDGKARYMSLVNMSATDPEHGTTATGNDLANNPGAGLCWGYNQQLIGPEFNAVPQYTGEQQVYDEITGVSGDSYIGIEHDPDDSAFINLYGDVYLYTDDGYFSDCTLNEDGSINPKLSMSQFEFDGDNYLNALSDKIGAIRTSAIIAEATKYATGAITKNDYSEGSYPAAMACHRFYTPGTTAGQWYLPALGELAYVAARLDTINNKLEDLGNLAVKVGDYSTSGSLGYNLWSSSEYYTGYAWRLHTFNGYVYRSAKDYSNENYRVRSFLAL